MKVMALKNSILYDISEIISSKIWKGSKTQAPRSLSFTLIRTDGFDLSLGDKVIMTDDNDNKLFVGYVWERTRAKNKKTQILCYDSLLYFTKNSDTLSYKNKSVDEIFIDICKRCGISYGKVDKSSYKIPSLEAPNKTYYDTLLDALSRVYKQKGARFFVRDNAGKPELIQRINQLHTWVIESGVNLIDYSGTESLENTFTKVKIVSGENKKSSSITLSNAILIKQFGIMQYFEETQDKLTKSQMTALAQNLLKEKGKINDYFDISCLGLLEVKTGDMILLSIKDIGISKSYYVDEDTHEFKGKNHTMSLRLTSSHELG